MTTTTSPRLRVITISFSLLFASTALAAPADERASLSLDSSIFTNQPQTEPTAPIEQMKFAEEGTWWWSVGAVVAPVGDTDGDYGAAVQFHYFIVDDFEMAVELNGTFFNEEEGEDPKGGSANLVFRWHFLHKDRFTVFAEAGAGVQITSDELPDGGSEFNFTPRAGMGITWQMFENNPMRLLLGARWQHVSNARTQGGSSRNPGRDVGAIYAAVMFPF